MSVLLNAMQLEKGAKVSRNRTGVTTRPLQFLSRDQKDEQWGMDNLDWLEQVGLQQVKHKSKRLLKKYKMAAGILDRSDYICEQNPEFGEFLDILSREQENPAMELKFFPIIPSIIDLMIGEFAERTDKIMYRAVDTRSYNEMLEQKRSDVEQVLLADAEQDLLATMQRMGIEPDSEQGQQMLSPENLKTLPEIEQFYTKDYRSIVEEWSTHQHRHDSERFRIGELELDAYRDLLVTESEFWHLEMREDDYEVENWNPALTFHDVSPGLKYVSQGNHVGKFDLMSPSDVIDKFGYKMTAEQLESMQFFFPSQDSRYLLPGLQNDGSFYDASRSREWNTNMPSLGMRQYMAAANFHLAGDDILTQILSEGSEDTPFGNSSLFRVTTGYWKSQRMLFYVTEIDEQTGMKVKTIVDETFKCTTKPVYNTTVRKDKSPDTLIYGQHLEPIWINEVWGGVKIGTNSTGWAAGSVSMDGFEPIYLDVKPLKFQFKGDFSPYGCKLPVEGVVNTSRNTKAHGLVDRLIPYQIGHNIMMNQIIDITMDELGVVLMLDQNALPQHSMGEDWGKANLARTYVAMKDFKILPLDTAVTNTDIPLHFNQYQQLNLEETNRLLGKVNLATFFKEGAFETIGITPQRRGDIGGQETAEGIKQSTARSYAMTEKYYIQHSEQVMPRVHQMRTDLAQWYHSHNPSVRLSYITSNEEKVNFKINGTTLLSRELNVYVTTKVNQRRMMEQIRQLAIQNNTAGASIFDLGNLVKAESLAEVQSVLKGIETKIEQTRMAEQQHEKELQGIADEAAAARQEDQQRFEAEENALDRQTEITIAELKGAGYQVNDLDGSGQADYFDALDRIEKNRLSNETLQLKREAQTAKNMQEDRKLNQKDRDISSRERIAQTQLQIARENKNRFDKKEKPANKKK